MKCQIVGGILTLRTLMTVTGSLVCKTIRRSSKRNQLCICIVITCTGVVTSPTLYKRMCVFFFHFTSTTLLHTTTSNKPKPPLLQQRWRRQEDRRRTLAIERQRSSIVRLLYLLVLVNSQEGRAPYLFVVSGATTHQM